jgi:hypothetical protein
MDKIFTIILNWNGARDTIECIHSIPQNQRVVVIDNGSKDNSVERIRYSCPHVTLIETGQNLGYAGGNNVGIEYALAQGAEKVLILNNDTVVDKQFYDELEKSPFDITGARALVYSNPSKLDHLGGVWNPKTAQFDLIGSGKPADFAYDGPLDYVCGCAILIHRRVFEKVGLFHPDFFLFWEEADLCMRAKKSGFKMGIANDACLKHKVSASFTGGKPHIAYYWWRNRFLWIERNLSLTDRTRYFFTLFIPETFKHLKRVLIKKDANHSAALKGLRDYFLRRFGENMIKRK